jgi:hypothetical protein
MSARQWDGDPQTVIRILAKDNPKQPSRKAYGRFALYRDGMTVEEYGNACHSAPDSTKVQKNDYLVDITADKDRGYILLEPPRTARDPLA